MNHVPVCVLAERDGELRSQNHLCHLWPGTAHISPSWSSPPSPLKLSLLISQHFLNVISPGRTETYPLIVIDCSCHDLLLVYCSE